MHPLVRYIREALHGYYTDVEALSLAKMLLVDVFGFTTLELYGGKDRSFSENEQELLSDIVKRLQNHEPLQYIIGRETFMGLDIEVDENVLIPRPETQELVNWILDDYRLDEGCKILDIGTGSGCIPIALAHYMSGAELEAWDISDGALELAQRNAKRNDVKVLFCKQNVLEMVPSALRYDVIVSNPPYITEKEKVDMEPNVLDWEPSIALFVPDSDPLLFYRKIAELGLGMLVQGGALYFEINRAYGAMMKSMLENMGYKHVELRKDMFGNDRMIKAIK